MPLVEIRVPGDKSLSHRALLFAALADGESEISGLLPGADCQSTASCLRALGVDVPELPTDGFRFRMKGVGLRGLQSPTEVLDCGNSGTTARLLMGLLAGAGVVATLDGDASLRRRPMRRVTEPLIALGARFTELGAPGCLPIRIEAGVHAAPHFEPDAPFVWVSPVASAQVKSAILLAGLAAGRAVTLEEPERSRDHTERMLRQMGVAVASVSDPDGRHRVTLAPPAAQAPHVGATGIFGHRLAPLNFEVPGDPSSAAFFVALALLGGVANGAALRIRNVGMNPTRAGVFPVFQRMGGEILIEAPQAWDDPAGEPVADLQIIPCRAPSILMGTRVEGPEVPSLIDEIPLIAAVGARASGVTSIRDAAELRVKESDRIEAMASNLGELGVQVQTVPDGFDVVGAAGPLRGRVQTFHDHRIAMAFGILGALPGNDVSVEDPEMVEVSFPGFWARLEQVTGKPMRPSNTPIIPNTPNSPNSLVITLDGPAGSGKSTTARAVAARLGYGHLDSGALYRAVTLALLESGICETEWDAVELAQLQAFQVSVDPDPSEGAFRVRLAGRDPGEALRTPDVTSRVSRVAKIPAVRGWLLEAQRATGRRGGVVADGRDMGTVVFPDAALKIFLDADLNERARRRHLQEAEARGGAPQTAAAASPEILAAEAKALSARDEADRNRAVAPLKPADDAVRLDTTGLTFEAQVNQIVGLAQDRLR